MSSYQFLNVSIPLCNKGCRFHQIFWDTSSSKLHVHPEGRKLCDVLWFLLLSHVFFPLHRLKLTPKRTKWVTHHSPEHNYKTWLLTQYCIVLTWCTKIFVSPPISSSHCTLVGNDIRGTSTWFLVSRTIKVLCFLGHPPHHSESSHNCKSLIALDNFKERITIFFRPLPFPFAHHKNRKSSTNGNTLS